MQTQITCANNWGINRLSFKEGIWLANTHTRHSMITKYGTETWKSKPQGTTILYLLENT